MAGSFPGENLLWQNMGNMLIQRLPLPKIYGYLETDQNGTGDYALLEDLGDRRLDRQFFSATGESNAALYKPVIKILARWHKIALDLVRNSPSLGQNPDYSPAFAYKAEWRYFLTTLADLGLPEIGSAAGEKSLAWLMEFPAYPEVLIHRDFQSRNLIVAGAQVYILDWQGGRKGPAAYDLASLLYDPYVNLTDDDREQLLDQYQKERPEPGLRAVLTKIAPLRLMQTIGAYGHLVSRGLPYGAYLAPALTRLKVLLLTRPDFSEFCSLLDLAIDKAKKLHPSPAAFY
jgi:aminoglycoside/choline kinase family phosphotransferase